MSGEMERRKACEILKVSLRTIERWVAKYERVGIYFVKHGNYKRSPINKTPERTKELVLDLVHEKYFDFNMLHALEKLKSEGFAIKRETFRKWCHQAKHVKRRHKRRGRARFRRDRVGSAGVLLQLDGSYHKWFGDQESCLIAAIDDATNEVPYAEFFESETTFSCFKVIKKIIEKKGLFKVLYVDQAGVYGGRKRENFSQLQRALGDIGIHVIFAQSPEAKGRVERLFGTLQDRMIPEMRLAGVTNTIQANEYMQKVFLPHHYQPRFTVEPVNPISSYNKVLPIYDLDEIFCLKDWRTVARDHTVSLNGQRYLIVSPFKDSIYRQSIELRTYEDGSFKAFFANKEIQLVPIQKIKKTAI